MSTSTRLVIQRSFEAPIDLVWRAWTERAHLLRWLCPKDFEVLFAEVDLRTGGVWRSGMRDARGQEYVARGTYREIQEPHRLVFTHEWEKNELEPSVETMVTLTLRSISDRETEMTFEQVGLATTESRDSHLGGWSEAFDHLQAHLERAPSDASRS